MKNKYIVERNMPIFKMILTSNLKIALNLIDKYVNHDIENKKSLYINLFFNCEKDIDLSNFFEEKLDNIDYNYRDYDMKSYWSNKCRVIKWKYKTNKITIYVDYDNNIIEIYVKKYRKYVMSFIESYLEICIAHFLRLNNLIPMHGSAFVLDNQCFTLIGKSGVGKSTTLLQFLDEGAILVANDFFAIDYKNRKIYSLDRTIAVRKSKILKKLSIMKNFKKRGYLFHSLQKYFDAQVIFKEFIKEYDIEFISFLEITENNKINIKKLSESKSLIYWNNTKIKYPFSIENPIDNINMFKKFYNNFRFIAIEIPNFKKKILKKGEKNFTLEEFLECKYEFNSINYRDS